MRIESKIDTLTEHVQEINITLAKQHVTLEEHQRRSAANERAVELLEAKIEPLAKHVLMVNGVVKFIITLSAIAAIIEVFKK